jgi:hypothetical protein
LVALLIRSGELRLEVCDVRLCGSSIEHGRGGRRRHDGDGRTRTARLTLLARTTTTTRRGGGVSNTDPKPL